jgi:cytochrome c oxidase assembly factor CtaG
VGVLTDWTFDPLQLAPVALAAFAYGTRARTLARRGTPVPRWRIALFSLGIVLLLLAFASPIAAIGEEELFSFHMLQHVIVGDLAPLCLLAGLNGPLLRPLLAFRLVERLRVLANPLVALPLWAVNLYLWHVPALYEAAVEHSAVHALEHVCFFAAGLVVWLPVLETLPAPEWFGTGLKLAYVAGVRVVETVLGNVFVWSGAVFYGVYDRGEELWGVSPLQDQGLAGAVMMIEGSLVTIAALAWLFLRLAREGELRQELLERGLDPRSVRRAVRYGRAQELAASSSTTRTGAGSASTSPGSPRRTPRT